VVLAQVAESLTTSSTVLGFLLSATTIGAAYSAYKFIVNFRTTERGLSRQRITQANKNERAAQYEASLWQARCGDLEYLLRKSGGTVPSLSEELRALVLAEDVALVDPSKWDQGTDRSAGSPAS
jgi:hypothetical protein